MAKIRIALCCFAACIVFYAFYSGCNRKPVFSDFGQFRFYLFAYPVGPFIDDWGNYIYYDLDKNILILVVTDNVGQISGKSSVLTGSLPWIKSENSCVIFSGTKHELDIKVKPNTITVINFKNEKILIASIDNGFVKDSVNDFYKTASIFDGEKSNLFLCLKNKLQKHGKEFDQIISD